MKTRGGLAQFHLHAANPLDALRGGGDDLSGTAFVAEQQKIERHRFVVHAVAEVEIARRDAVAEPPQRPVEKMPDRPAAMRVVRSVGDQSFDDLDRRRSLIFPAARLENHHRCAIAGTLPAVPVITIIAKPPSGRDGITTRPIKCFPVPTAVSPICYNAGKRFGGFGGKIWVFDVKWQFCR